jgi:hypothetical protein
MQMPIPDWKSRHGDLMVARALLFEKLLNNPFSLKLALEIKGVDDQIDQCAEHLKVPKEKGRPVL